MDPMDAMEMRIWEKLRGVRDPELPISIVDLGIVESCQIAGEGRRIEVTLTATRSSCPAKHHILREVERTLKEAFPSMDVSCRWHEAPMWTAARITEEGRRALAEFGYGVEGGTDGATVCPHCGKAALVREAGFGSSPCLSFYFCRSCRRPYELVRVHGLD